MSGEFPGSIIARRVPAPDPHPIFAFTAGGTVAERKEMAEFEKERAMQLVEMKHNPYDVADDLLDHLAYIDRSEIEELEPTYPEDIWELVGGPLRMRSASAVGGHTMAISVLATAA